MRLDLAYNGFLKIYKNDAGYEVMERGDSVTAVVIIEGTEDVLILMQNRLGAQIRFHENESYNLVAGMIDERETPDCAIIREVQEELGVSPIAMRYLGLGMPSQGGSSEVSHMYVVVVPDRPAYIPEDESEGITIFRVHSDKIDTMISEGRIKCSQMQLTWYKSVMPQLDYFQKGVL